MRLTKFKQSLEKEVNLSWSDGHIGTISLSSLRDACPCAGCKGETVLFRTYMPPTPDTSTPGRYTLQSATPVGNYALKLTWGDGHDMGMYTWEHLRNICECDACIANRTIRAEE